MESDFEALYQQEKKKRIQAESLLQIADRLNSGMNLDMTLTAVGQLTAEFLKVQVVTISLYDEQKQELHLAYKLGLPETFQQTTPLTKEQINWAMAEEDLISVVLDIQAMPDLPYADLYQKIDLRTVASVNLLLNGQLIGRLNAGILSEVRPLSSYDRKLLEFVADQAAIAIHRALLLEERRRHAQELEESVLFRTAAFEASNQEKEEALEALRSYTEELQTHNAELDAFAHTVAHDLHGPLSIMIGLADLLLDEEDTPLPMEIQKDYLKKIMRQGHKMHNIVNEILLLASIRKAEIQTGPIVDMAVIVNEALRRVGQLIDEYNTEIVLPDAWPVAVGYGPWIEEVWTNFLSNAIKYGGQPPRLELRASSANSIVRFGVKDNGEGLSAEAQARLFTPFTRLHQVRISGHGLGLSIVHRILTKLDGRVGVVSQPGYGSFFYFELPAEKDAH